MADAKQCDSCYTFFPIMEEVKQEFHEKSDEFFHTNDKGEISIYDNNNIPHVKNLCPKCMHELLMKLNMNVFLDPRLGNKKLEDEIMKGEEND